METGPVVPYRNAGRTLVVCLAVLAATLSMAACTPAQDQPPSTASTAPATPSATHPSSDPAEVALVSPEAQPTFSPKSIHVLAQETVKRGTTKFEVLRVRAPQASRFLIGTGDSADLAVPCRTAIAKPQEVEYRVECPRQGAGQKLFSLTTYGDFDFGFTKKLK